MGWIWLAIGLLFALLTVLALVVRSLEELNKSRKDAIVNVLMDHKKYIEKYMDGATDRERWEADAVKHGAATWSVDENGNRFFRWKEQEQGKK